MIKIIFGSVFYLFSTLILLWIVWPLGAVALLLSPFMLHQAVSDFLDRKRWDEMVARQLEEQKKQREEVMSVLSSLGIKFQD